MLMNTWREALPKVELHLHLEGAIPHLALLELIRKYGAGSEIPSLEALEERLRFTTFREFLGCWTWKNRFLREYEDFTWIAEAAARDMERQNIIYAEVFCSPSDFAGHGLETQPLVRAIRAGLDRVPGIRIGLVVDLVRDYGVQNAERTLEQLREVRDQGVIGIGIGGSEHRFPPEMYRDVYEKARAFGFHTTAHAGEAAGAESMWGAIRELRVERIGHGTRAGEDPALLEELVRSKMPLEMCPLSNVRTGTVHSIEAHPIRRYFDLGLLVTVNTDDPGMFGNSLAEEYRLLMDRHGFTQDEIRSIVANAARASWLPEDEKAELVARLESTQAH